MEDVGVARRGADPHLPWEIGGRQMPAQIRLEDLISAPSELLGPNPAMPGCTKSGARLHK